MNESLTACGLFYAVILATCLLLNEVLPVSCKKFICRSELIQTWHCLAESEIRLPRLSGVFRVSPEAMSEPPRQRLVLVLAEIRVGSCEQSWPCCDSFRGHALALQQS